MLAVWQSEDSRFCNDSPLEQGRRTRDEGIRVRDERELVHHRRVFHKWPGEVRPGLQATRKWVTNRRQGACTRSEARVRVQVRAGSWRHERERRGLRPPWQWC
jgi:hypothetical protein